MKLIDKIITSIKENPENWDMASSVVTNADNELQVYAPYELFGCLVTAEIWKPVRMPVGFFDAYRLNRVLKRARKEALKKFLDEYES